MTADVLPRPARIAGLVFAGLLGALLVASVAAAAWIGLRGLAAYQHLRAAEATVREAVDSLDDPALASGLIADLARETGAARDLTGDPVWRAAEHLPWVGPQLAAVSTIAVAADDVAGDALAPLAEVASTFSLDQLRPVEGRIDTTMLHTIADSARVGADGVAAAAAAVDAIDETLLLAPVRSATAEVSDLLRTATTATDALARATVLLPPMLGTDGERDYLIVFQNNAEWRSLGGIVGAMAVVNAADGALQLVAQGSSSDFSRYDDPVLPLAEDVQAIYDTRPGRWVQNVTQVPDFSVAAPLAREMWLRETGQDVDGVIAMDPIALSYLLEATGPVALPTGDVLSADNAVQLLLNDVYLRYERPSDQDDFFAAAAATVFDAIAAGGVDPAQMVTALSRAGDERRLLLWSSVEAEQAELSGTTLAGGLPKTDDQTARFGVYLNDGTGSKMDYYVSAQTDLSWESCSLDGRGLATGEATLSLVLANTAPADAATSLPWYITGGGNFGVPAGTARTVAYVYLPEGYELTDAVLSLDKGFGGGTHDGRQVLSFGADLAPGESVTATISVRSPEPGAPTVVAEVTPTIDRSVPTSVVSHCPAP
ncbi:MULTISPECIES: DUF4012 domain-containing protein [unclassified Microbacterium]|uniref:DUF4012 domain-containing protein n=1 Tax=unclassified Microbacterium TaxID=2609290 RepID=UPI00214C5635|nr:MULTISPECIES: DUF4012 domain-containing protein [unclassified Microbacterium]MCR2801924.1 DUF4012 domain-containing protein [Microbacterium sp. zg.Y818]MCR2824230.1 DUF4012 domain-containing protein [Microbacterium sp. zg.Y909]WIM22819.1 DUF4012 domain-containing protein [Microbacterium sp. zg-Y818]